MNADSHFVSVIIPSVGRKSLAHTKEALLAQTRPPDELIIVFDRDRRGPSYPRNEGIRKSRGDLIAFTDDDCVPGKNWLERMISAIDKYDAALVSSHYDETDPLLQEVRLRRFFPDSDRINPTGFVGNAGNVIYRRHCLEECEKKDGFVFNPIYGIFAAEDSDLALRLKQMGYRVVYINNNVQHLKKLTLLKYFEFQFKRGVGIGLFYKEHKNDGREFAPDKSMLWSPSKRYFPLAKWLVIIWKKVLGPFDRRSFSSSRRFWTFWAGEKLQALGFIYAVLYKHRNQRVLKTR
ncbi:MAG: glycosyltransferase family 2 protein [Desulfobacterales bacterium]|jgi:glycosyltransferase involved in cell wall biosynthesis|nr:glycosyltransferase family 2 protein [Desulfobacterales bacterium]